MLHDFLLGAGAPAFLVPGGQINPNRPGTSSVFWFCRYHTCDVIASSFVITRHCSSPRWNKEYGLVYNVRMKVESFARIKSTSHSFQSSPCWYEIKRKEGIQRAIWNQRTREIYFWLTRETYFWFTRETIPDLPKMYLKLTIEIHEGEKDPRGTEPRGKDWEGPRILTAEKI